MYVEGQRSMEQASALEQSLQNQLKILRDHQNELHEKEKQLVKVILLIHLLLLIYTKRIE